MRTHRTGRRRSIGLGLAAAGAVVLSALAAPATADEPSEGEPAARDATDAANASAGASNTSDNGSEDGPDNIIVVVGDGMGYNHIDMASMFESDQSRYQVAVDPEAGTIEDVDGDTPTQVYEHWPVQYAMSTFSVGGSYDPEVMWGDFAASTLAAPTDSAAAATAMATGVKTINQAVGVDREGAPIENVVERAQAQGRATGVVTNVVVPHPTTAAFAIHNESRLDYLAVSDLLVDESGLNVVMGSGHPWYDDNGDRYDEPDFNYVSEETWTRLENGDTPFEFIEERADFQALAGAEAPPTHVMGFAQAWTTTQEARGDGESDVPFEDPFIETVPELSEMTLGALNVLDNASDEGFFLAVESGAIDWSSELNAPARAIEETITLNETVEAISDWVETHSSWDETMVVVTADHEAGYITGPDSDPAWTPMVSNGVGELPDHEWHRLAHSNHLVPFFAIGAGSEAFHARATGEDPVRGSYLDNADIGQVMLDELWAEQDDPGEPDPEPVPPSPGRGFYLNDGWEIWADHEFSFGRPGDEVLVGDWDGDGSDTLAVRRGNRYFLSNSLYGGAAEVELTYGRADDAVLVGDWDGNGADSFAVRRGNSYFLSNSLTGGNADAVLDYGRADDTVLVGDYDGDAVDTFTVRRGNTYFVSNSLSTGWADVELDYGRASDDVLVGDWDGDAVDTFAVRRGNLYLVSNSLTSTVADTEVRYGRAGDEVYVGDWDGDGSDTLGVRR
ncbi:alkaline phosphatase [Georgenia sp. Z1491]|uniref:alkaline phosphatase n=1 Tax=Georgenia sp. Z1491 TaxID=3416707 RepID=UPI003CF0C31F